MQRDQRDGIYYEIPRDYGGDPKGIDDADNGRVIRQEEGERIDEFLARI